MTHTFELILPFLEPIAGLLQDDEVSEIMRNGDGRVYVERRGRMVEADIRLDEQDLASAAVNIARALSGDINEASPMFDGQLDDGSRVGIVLPPISKGGITLNIRRFNNHRYDIEQLLAVGSISQTALDVIRQELDDEQNILISGGTSTGKTTLMNALSPFLGDCRMVVIEDTAELHLHQSNIVRMIARKADPVAKLPAVSIRHLLQMAMRQRPDRIIVGEVRGAEALELLNALNSGHGGSMATIHAASAKRALSKMESYVAQAGENVQRIEHLIAEAINVVVQLQRDRSTGRRYVSEIVRVDGYDKARGEYRIGHLATCLSELVVHAG